MNGNGGTMEHVFQALLLIAWAVSAAPAHAGVAITYTYDDLNRLTDVARDDGVSVGYAYDEVGNLTQRASVGPSVDTDGDGIPDAVDNCIQAANPNQLDTNGDGIGNMCDCDFNNDNFCGGPDFTLFIGCFNKATGGNATCQAADMNGDNFVGGPDFTLFIGGFNGPPGPAAP